MLTLDEPDRTTPDGWHGTTLPLAIDDLQQLRHLVGSVRQWFAVADQTPAADPDRLYRAHGEPRD